MMRTSYPRVRARVVSITLYTGNKLSGNLSDEPVRLQERLVRASSPEFRTSTYVPAWGVDSFEPMLYGGS